MTFFHKEVRSGHNGFSTQRPRQPLLLALPSFCYSYIWTISHTILCTFYFFGDEPEDTDKLSHYSASTNINAIKQIILEMYSELHVLVDTKTMKINRMCHLISLCIAMDMDLIQISFFGKILLVTDHNAQFTNEGQFRHLFRITVLR